MSEIHIQAAQNKGTKSVQEDTYWYSYFPGVRTQRYRYIPLAAIAVADGVSTKMGAKASNTFRHAIRSLRDRLPTTHQSSATTNVKEAVEHAGHTLFEKHRGNAITTATVGVVEKTEDKRYLLSYAAVGDSPIYLRRKGQQTLTKLTIDEAANGNVLVNGLGNSQNRVFEGRNNTFIALLPGDEILFCTDGVSHSPNFGGDIQQVDMSRLMRRRGLFSAPTLDADKIAREASKRQRGTRYYDNATAVVVQVG